MNYKAIMIAAAVVAVFVTIWNIVFHILEKEQDEEVTIPQKQNTAKKAESAKEETAEIPEDESLNQIHQIHEEIFDDNVDLKHEIYQGALPDEIRDLVTAEKKEADEKRRYNETLYPNAVSHTGSIRLDEIQQTAGEEPVDKVVDRMMDEIMRSIADQEESSAAGQEETMGLDLQTLEMIEDINRSSEQALADTAALEPIAEETAEAEDGELDVQKMIEQRVVIKEGAEPKLKEAEDPEALMNVIRDINIHAEKNSSAAETIEAEAVPVKKVPMAGAGPADCGLMQWNGTYGKGKPVLYFFRDASHYEIFADAVRRMFEKELRPAYRFFAILCEDRSREALVLQTAGEWLRENGCEVGRVLVDTVNTEHMSDEGILVGIATGTMMCLRFDEMSECGVAELLSCARDAVNAGAHCEYDPKEGIMTIMSNEDQEAESVLMTVRDIAQNHDFGIHMVSRRAASEILNANHAFCGSVTNAVKRTFKTRAVRSGVLDHSEWNGGLIDCEAVWYTPAQKRAVSFYLNLLCVE